MWRVHVRLRGVRVHWFRWVGLLHLIAGVAYLYWRITEGLTGLGSLLFWGAEAYVWLAAVGFTLSRYAQVPSETLPSPEVLRRAFFSTAAGGRAGHTPAGLSGGHSADGALSPTLGLPLGAAICPHCGSG
jgi:hypothetical protein